MTYAFTRSLSATAAISAVLALGSTPALAQEAAPVIQVPPIAAAPSAPAAATAPATAAPSVAPPASAPPAIVLPDVSTGTDPAASTAPVTASAEPSAPAKEPRAGTTTSRARQPRAATAQPAARTQPTSAETPAAPRSSAAEPTRASSANILNEAPARPASADRVAAQSAAAAPESRSDDGISGEAIAGLLAALGLGAVGYAALRSRRRRADPADEVYADSLVAERPIDEDLEQAPRTAPVFGPMFGMPQTAARDRHVHYGFQPANESIVGDSQVIEREPMVVAPPVAPSPGRARTGFAMPASAPTTAEERTALLDRMVAADPDAANPFTSTKARRKRARLILQRHETDSRRDRPFDWRSYRPATKPTTPASPPLVTA